METYPKCEIRQALGKITAVLTAAFLAAMTIGCTPQAPVNVEMTKTGEIIRVVDASGTTLPTQNYPTVGRPIGGAPLPYTGQGVAPTAASADLLGMRLYGPDRHVSLGVLTGVP